MTDQTDIDTRKRAPGTIIFRVIAIRIGDTELPEEIVANIDIEPAAVANLLPTGPGQQAWLGWAIGGAKQVYARMKEKGWIK